MTVGQAARADEGARGAPRALRRRGAEALAVAALPELAVVARLDLAAWPAVEPGAPGTPASIPLRLPLVA